MPLFASVDIKDEWATITISSTIEVEGTEKPACVAEVIFRYRF